MNKSTNNIPLFILISLTMLITAFIFSNSLKNGEESNAQSEPIVEAVETVLDPEDKIPTKTFNYIVRKAAHVVEFTALGLTLAGQVGCVNRMKKRGQADKRSKRYIATGVLIGLLIAAADEIIQSFTGRTSSVTDVLIDTAGVVLGMSLVCLAMLFMRWKRSKPENPANTGDNEREYPA